MPDDPERIEPEEDAPSGEDIRQPFDPNKIKVNLWTPTLDLLVKRMKAKEIDLAPDFQRDAGLWKPRNKSRLVESLLIRIPLPAFYLDAVDEDTMAVIDGIQRLSALRGFVEGEFPLTDLEFLTDLDGRRFVDLPRPLQRRIEETMVTVYVVEKGTPDEAKLNIFKRINTGGLALSSQEIRHAMNPGPVRDFLKRLANGESFRRATAGGVRADRMDDRECVTRFVAFSQTAYGEYKAVDFDGFLNDAMRKVNRMTDRERSELEARFCTAMDRAAELFGSDAFRKRFAAEEARKPVNRAMFESWSVTLANLPAEKFARLAPRAEAVRSRLIDAFNAPPPLGEPSLADAVSFGTGSIKKVRRRFAAAEEIIEATLG